VNGAPVAAGVRLRARRRLASRCIAWWAIALAGCQAIAGLDAPLSSPGDASAWSSDAAAVEDDSGQVDGFVAADASTEADVPSSEDANADTGLDDASPACDGAVLTTDSHNCGACGHDCLGGQCVNGVCQPITILAKESHPIDIAVDDTTTPPTVFFLDVGSANATTGMLLAPYSDGAVVRVGADGSGRKDLARAKGSTRVGQPACLVVGGTNVYFTNQLTGAVLLVPKEVLDASAVQSIRDPVPMSPALGLAVDEYPDSGGRVFWTEAVTHNVVKTSLPPKSAGDDVLFTAGDVPWALVIDGKTTFVQVRATEQLLSAPRLGCAGTDAGCPTGLVKGANLEWGCKAIALDKDYVYYKDGSTADAGIYRVSKDAGAPPAQVSWTPPAPAHIVVAKGYVYWTAEVPDELGNGNVFRRQSDGTGPVEVLASKQFYPRGIAVDDQAAYWVNQGTPTNFAEANLLNAFDKVDGTVMKVALPP
jgi:hypothetical protein